MDKTTLQHLCDLSRLRYEDSELDAVMAEMTDIISLMDKIKEFDLTYDDTKNSGAIQTDELRSDIAEASFPQEELLKNTVHSEGCYIVPKVVE